MTPRISDDRLRRFAPWLERIVCVAGAVSLVGPRDPEAVVVQAGVDLQEHALAPPRWVAG